MIDAEYRSSLINLCQFPSYVLSHQIHFQAEGQPSDVHVFHFHGGRDELVPVGDETLHLGLQGLGGSSLLYLKNFDAYCNGVCSHAGLIHLKRSGPQDLKLDLVLL
jgi:hypothetical protein